MKSNIILKRFIGFSLVYLLIIHFGKEEIAWFFKPFLLPFLILAVYVHERFITKKVLLTALTLSWIGDIILMFADKGELYFIAGLIAFLLSHIFYIILSPVRFHLSWSPDYRAFHKRDLTPKAGYGKA